MSKKMKKVVFNKVDELLAVTEGGIPVPQKGQLLLRVKACGICGSDLHLSQAGLIPAGHVMGHEFSGEIVEVGVGTEGDWQEGDRVVTVPVFSCGTCAACMAGNPKSCSSAVAIGCGDDSAPGAYAEYVIVPADTTLKISDALSWVDAACIEPFAVGLHTVRVAKIEPGENILIVGAGPIGLTVACWARFCGAENVVVSERVPKRMELARKMGADVVLDVDLEEDLIAAYTRETGATPDAIIEAVGVPGMIQQCIHIAPRESRIVVVGVCMEPDTIVPMEAILKELTVTFVYGYEIRDYRLALSMAGAGRIEPGKLITGEINIEELPQAFEDLRTPNDQCKVILVP